MKEFDEKSESSKAAFEGFKQELEIRSLNPTVDRILEETKDKELVIYIANMMAQRLAEQRAKGRHGWWDKNNCSDEELVRGMEDSKGMENLLIYQAMMVYRLAH